MGKRIEHRTDIFAANIRTILERATPEQWDRGMVWYPVAGELCRAISERTGFSWDTVAAVVSALSPRNKWARNIADAAAFCEARANGQATRPTACTFHTNSDKAWTLLHAYDWRNILSGIKVESFVANITGDYDRVTVDVWAVRVATLGAEDAVRTDSHYRAIETAYQTVAAEYGIQPAMAQAIAWVVAQDACKGLKGAKNTREARMARLAA